MAKQTTPKKDAALDELGILYQRARQEWDDRIGSTVQQLKIWRVVAIISLSIAAFSVMGISYIGAQSKIEPYALAISDNQAIALQKLQNLPHSEDEMVTRSIISTFIANVRSVYADPQAQREATIRAYAHLRQNSMAYQQVTDYLGKTHVPTSRAEDELDTVKVNSVLPLGQGNTYQVDWQETIVDRQGTITSEPKFRAVITTEYHTPATEQGFMSNPTGLWITTYQVTEI